MKYWFPIKLINSSDTTIDPEFYKNVDYEKIGMHVVVRDIQIVKLIKLIYSYKAGSVHFDTYFFRNFI